MIGFRMTPKNRYSISKLYPLVGGTLFSEFKDLLNNLDNLEIIIYSFMSMQRNEVLNEVNELKQLKKDVILIAGGPHSSGAPEDTISMGFDHVIIGEGEITLPELVNSIKSGKTSENILIGKPIENFDCYDKIWPLAPIEITRGCPYNCRFCQTPQIFGKNIRHRSIDSIVKIVKTMGDIRFVTPNAFSYGSKTGLKPDIEKLENLMKNLFEIKKRLFFGTFPSEVRPEFILPKTLDLVNKYCDNTFIHFGAQSGSDEVLQYIRRGHTVSDVINAVENCRESGLTPKVDFIFGFPKENELQRKESIELIKHIIKKNGKVHAHYFMPLCGTYFEKESPETLEKGVLEILGKMAKKGQITGSWGYQYSEKDKN